MDFPKNLKTDLPRKLAKSFLGIPTKNSNK